MRRVIAIGTLDQPYKGFGRLIDAMVRCRAEGLPLELTIVGDGVLRGQLERQAACLGVAQHIRFLGRLPAGRAVREQLDRADLFVMPSLTEGLPRAMIEAMARGLPCIGTRVGGIPELIGPTELVLPGDSDCLYAKVVELAGSPQRCVALSDENLRRARNFHEDVLSERRNAFYRRLRDVTEAYWTAQRQTA